MGMCVCRTKECDILFREIITNTRPGAYITMYVVQFTFHNHKFTVHKHYQTVV